MSRAACSLWQRCRERRCVHVPITYLICANACVGVTASICCTSGVCRYQQ
jgi:hypothetical protein